MKPAGQHGVLLASVLATWITSVAGFKVFCNMEQHGNSGTLTCKFSIDLRQSKYDFAVQRYDLVDDVTPDKVLGCIFRKDREDPDCKAEDGYEFDKNTISDTIILKMPHLEKKHEGWYICQVIPPLDEQNKTGHCKYEHTETRSAKEPDSTRMNLAVPILIAVCVILVAIIIVIGICRKRIFKKIHEICDSEPKEINIPESRSMTETEQAV